MKKGPQFSRIIAGTMSWGSWGRNWDTTAMGRFLKSAFDMGITTFDLADIYGDYSTEGHFGKALKSTGIPRSRLQLISKCGIQLPSPNRENRVKHYDCSKAYIIASVERSLHALQTDYLDVLLLHRPSPLMEAAEIAGAVQKLLELGKIKRFGVSNFSPSQIALIETVVPVSVHQFECSLTTDSPLTNGILDDISIHGRTAMAWSPLGSVFKAPDAIPTKCSAVMDALCDTYDCSLDQLLLLWLLSHPARIHPVLGTTKIERLAHAHAFREGVIDLQDWFLLWEAWNGNEVP